MKLLKNEQGVALVVVIMVLAVTAILGATVLTFMVSDTKFAESQEDHLQAEYIARAGADVAGKYVQDNPRLFNPGKTFTGTLGTGSFSATISGAPFAETVTVSSKGTVNGVSEAVVLHLKKQTNSGMFKGVRQTLKDKPLDLEQLAIDPGSNTVTIEANVQDPENSIDLSASDEADPQIVKAANYDHPGEVILPTGYTSFSNEVTVDNKTNTTTVTGNKYLSSLDKGNGDTIIFDTQGNDQLVVVNDLSWTGSKGDVSAIGGGTVHLFIRNSGSIQNPLQVTTGLPPKLFIYVADGKTLDLQANGEINAYIYGPNATVQIQSDKTTVVGAIIAKLLLKNINNGAHGMFEYVPPAGNIDYEGFLLYVKDYYSK